MMNNAMDVMKIILSKFLFCTQERTRQKCNYINDLKCSSFLFFFSHHCNTHWEMKWKPQIFTKLFISMSSVIAYILKKQRSYEDRERVRERARVSRIKWISIKRNTLKMKLFSFGKTGNCIRPFQLRYTRVVLLMLWFPSFSVIIKSAIEGMLCCCANKGNSERRRVEKRVLKRSKAIEKENSMELGRAKWIPLQCFDQSEWIGKRKELKLWEIENIERPS